MQLRTDKTVREFQNLKAETVDDTSKTISPLVYERICVQAKDILRKFEQKREIKQAPTLTMLLEIETRVEGADSYIA